MLLAVYLIYTTSIFGFLHVWMLHVTFVLSIYSPGNYKFALLFKKMVGSWKTTTFSIEMVQFQETFVHF